MLSFTLLKNNAGILLSGDHHSLRILADVAYEVNDESIIIKNRDGALMNLSYDVRQAYEGQAKTLKPSPLMPEVGVRYGVECLWPALLLQSRMLRVSMSYLPTTRIQHAIVYNLESVVADALKEAFSEQADLLEHLWLSIDPAHPWPEEKFHSRVGIFSSWTKAERKVMLAGLLQSFSPMYDLVYRKFYEERCLISPDDLDAWDELEWPDPKW